MKLKYEPDIYRFGIIRRARGWIESSSMAGVMLAPRNILCAHSLPASSG